LPAVNKPTLAFSQSPLGWRVLATNVLPLSQLHSRQPTQNPIKQKNGWGLECQKVNFLEPWKSAMPLVFQPALLTLQQPYKYYYTL